MHRNRNWASDSVISWTFASGTQYGLSGIPVSVPAAPAVGPRGVSGPADSAAATALTAGSTAAIRATAVNANHHRVPKYRALTGLMPALPF